MINRDTRVMSFKDLYEFESDCFCIRFQIIIKYFISSILKLYFLKKKEIGKTFSNNNNTYFEFHDTWPKL